MDTIKKEYSCCAIFVSYNPEDSIIDNVNQLVNQVAEILIVDNNSSEDSREFLLELDKNPKVSIIYNKDNLGIASALNQGVRYAIEHDYEWIATFDQDSKAPDNFIKSMFSTYSQYNSKEKLAIISPRYFDEVSGLITPERRIESHSTFFEIESTITSGNLVKTSVFRKIGLFAENFFIDCVDHEFCLRCLINDLKIVVSYESILTHNLGNTTLHYFMGRTYLTTNHSHIRRFYNSRNRVLLYYSYLFIESTHSKRVKEWILNDVVNFLKGMVIIILFEDDKQLKMEFILKGILDGIKKKGGKYI